MSLAASAAAICFISCHGGPADHFATFSEQLKGPIEIHASGPALKKFQDRGIVVTSSFSPDRLSSEEEDALGEQIAKLCSAAKVVITDVGHVFDIKIQKALARHAKNATRLAYYDNPEPFVPGGYSQVAAQVMQAAQGVLFANSNLAKAPLFQAPDQAIDLGDRKKVGIGYYPLQQAEKIAQRRIQEKSALRQAFHIDGSQKILVYFGGNNDAYFTKALPAFLSFLQQSPSLFENHVMILQQHPGAKAQDIDRHLLESWTRQNPRLKIILSDRSSDDAQTVADAALYYQTSMGPQFVLAGIPAIQVGHETYADILVKNHLCPSATNKDQLIQAIHDCWDRKEMPRQTLLDGLGIQDNWLQNLESALNF
jgi:hypothetical protein